MVVATHPRQRGPGLNGRRPTAECRLLVRSAGVDEPAGSQFERGAVRKHLVGVCVRVPRAEAFELVLRVEGRDRATVDQVNDIDPGRGSVRVPGMGNRLRCTVERRWQRTARLR